ncbi:hypothetical protein NXS19_012985 [Fusarium pseudograminearum]|nr:hypothetical protein NXS19_012985 [Fusarium pseudograminearum]
MAKRAESSQELELKEPDKNNIETEEEMRKRLSEGAKKNLENLSGMQIVGTMENPHNTWDRTAPIPEDEIDTIIQDIREVKLYLFCRLILSQASLLPAALKAKNVQEFLDDNTVAESDLRDLCLKVAEPTLQDVRDAAADFARGDKPDEIVSVDDDNDDDEETMGDLIKGDRKYSHLHTHDWFTDRVMTYGEKKNKKKKKKLKSSKSKSKVTICGKSIWNHASQNAMSRDGWFQFSVMAKDCDLKHAIQLCRNWSEFSDLTLLTIWQYFPASNWESWGSNRFTQQLQQLGFFPYFADFEAETNTRHHQVGGRSAGRRQHNMVEARNILVGNMKRNDPVTRRFIQYLLMRAGEVLVMVRDGKTGRVITAPPKEHLWTFRRKAGLGRAVKNDWDNILEMGPDFMKLTDTLREWRFGFNDYYDVYIWDLVPGEDHSEMYNRVVADLRNAWRISHPRQLYNHIEPLLRGLHRNNDTGHTRQIKPGEDVESIWDTMMDERSQIKLFNVVGTKVKEHSDADLEAATYMFYNKANEAEDAVLFPDELTRKNFAFREIANGISDIESGVLPSTARHLTKGLDAINLGKDPYKALRAVKDQEELTIWGLPNVWVTGLVQARKEKPDSKQKHLLQKTGLMGSHKNINFDMRMDTLEPMEMMERDRSFSFKESFHAGDLEPGYNAKYALLQKTLHAMLHTAHSGPTDWVWYIASILDWLDLRGDYEPEDYVLDPTAPWPHSFIVQDLVEAFAMMAMLFPGLEVTKLVTMFVNSSQCEEFRNSGVFDVEDRNKVRPDRRTRTSYKFREKGFWKEWNEFCNEKTSVFWADRYPMEWSLTVRPILAHLYKAGVIAPANVQPHPEVVKGIVTAQTEPHRPGKLDLFINFEDQYGNFSQTFPSSFVPPSQWPEIVPRAQSFAKSHPSARFALLRTWSSPHYYPFMVSPASRHMTSFVDSFNRSWECKFVPKDMPGSEYSAHHTIGKRLDLLKHKFGRRVMNRGDLVLVMGEDEDDLFKYCTAVTLAIQTKPWLREIDLWKSFINVDVDFIERMEEHWLE